MSFREHQFRYPDPLLVDEPSRPADRGADDDDGDLVLELEAQVTMLSSELRRTQERYQRLVETIPAATYILDSSGYVVEINAEGLRILGRPASDVVGSAFFQWVAPEDRELAVRGFRAGLAGKEKEQVHTTDLRIVLPSGERRVLQVRTAEIREGGGVVGLHCSALDVTDDRARETKLRRAERMASVGPLLRGICHEINNPLTSIQSFAELMLLDEREAEDSESLEIIRREAQRAARIISDLRVVARQTQEVGAGRSMVDLNEVTRRALRAHEVALQAAGVELRLELAPALPRVWGAAGQLEQVLTSLVANAEQAMRDAEGPRELTVRTCCVADGVSVTVQDTGHGIAPEHLERVFDPFWTTRPPGEGTGLGLSMANSIVSDHGGHIQVDSEPARGSVFVFSLPAMEQPPVSGSEPETRAAEHRTLQLLIVDDEAAIRQALGRYLERRGHEVDTASDGASALELLASERAADYDLVLADFWMPGLTGAELLDRLHARGLDAAERLVFMTGDSSNEDLQRVLQTHDLLVIQKPFELAEIVQVIEAQAEMRGEAAN